MAAMLASGVGAEVVEPERVVFATSDGGEIHADVYGSGMHGVVLAHGAVFDKESWRPLATVLAGDDLRVLALDFRGYGASKPGREEHGLYLDVLAAVDFLQRRAVEKVSVIGASMGGRAAAHAATRLPRGELYKVILLAPAPVESPEAINADSLLFVASRGEKGLARIRSQYQRAPDPKRLEVIDGNAHAQHVFMTERAAQLTAIIRRFLRD